MTIYLGFFSQCNVQVLVVGYSCGHYCIRCGLYFCNKDERFIFHEIAHITLRVRLIRMIVSCKKITARAQNMILARVNIKTD